MKNAPKLALDLVPPEWLLPSGQPTIIAGPCSAETREQVLATAQAIAPIPGLRIFRAGVWKPRTRPGSFEGSGQAALEWLREARELTGLQLAVEVATPAHVEACLAANVDILWVGARTAVNPFSVQEIADAIRGSDVAVLVKNPIAPDLHAWAGALERVNRAGIRRLAAIHRGFSNFTEVRLRFSPEWKIALDLRSLCPELPILCDPSHIAGKREFVPAVAAEALRLGMQGLMVETHCQPAAAWSDARQQLTPAALAQLWERLRDGIASHERFERDSSSQSGELLQKLALIDKQILEGLAARSRVLQELRRDARVSGKVLPLELRCSEETKANRQALAADLGLDPDAIELLYNGLSPLTEALDIGGSQ